MNESSVQWDLNASLLLNAEQELSIQIQQIDIVP